MVSGIIARSRVKATHFERECALNHNFKQKIKLCRPLFWGFQGFSHYGLLFFCIKLQIALNTAHFACRVQKL